MGSSTGFAPLGKMTSLTRLSLNEARTFDNAAATHLASLKNLRALHLFDNFNYTYTSVLKSLQTTFDGRPRDIDAAIGLMESCKSQAHALAEFALADGKRAGPGFQWQPING